MEASLKLCDADSDTSLLNMADAIVIVVRDFASVQHTCQLLGGDIATNNECPVVGIQRSRA